jgi:ferrous iron transport protein B
MAIVPMILGLGCNVPAALASRILETRRERFIAATIMAITVPCMAQTAMVVGLVGRVEGGVLGGGAVLAIIFGTLAATAVALGWVCNRLLKGESTELLVDIPPYRVPYLRGLGKKLWMRLSGFFREALPWVLGGVFLVNLLDAVGVIAFIGDLAAPVVEHLLGLPRAAVGGLVVGFLRKDVAVGMLAPLGLDWRQVAVACVVLTMYFPCVATFSVLLREFGLRDTARASLIMVGTAVGVGTLLNLVLGLF